MGKNYPYGVSSGPIYAAIMNQLTDAFASGNVEIETARAIR
jgi:hypothetical protein